MKDSEALVVAGQPMSSSLVLTHQENTQAVQKHQLVSVLHGKGILEIRAERTKLISDMQKVQQDLTAANVQLDKLVRDAGKHALENWAPLALFEKAFKAAKVKTPIKLSDPTLVVVNNKLSLAFSVNMHKRDGYGQILSIDAQVKAPASIIKQKKVLAAIDKRMAAIEDRMLELNEKEKRLAEDRQVNEAKIDAQVLLSNPETAHMLKQLVESDPNKIM